MSTHVTSGKNGITGKIFFGLVAFGLALWAAMGGWLLTWWGTAIVVLALLSAIGALLPERDLSKISRAEKIGTWILRIVVGGPLLWWIWGWGLVGQILVCLAGLVGVWWAAQKLLHKVGHRWPIFHQILGGAVPVALVVFVLLPAVGSGSWVAIGFAVLAVIVWLASYDHDFLHDWGHSIAHGWQEGSEFPLNLFGKGGGDKKARGGGHTKPAKKAGGGHKPAKAHGGGGHH